MKVGVRADASVQIGTGHVRRCLELARELTRRGAEVTFVWRDLGFDAGAMIAEAGFGSLRLPRPTEAFAAFPDLPPHALWAQVSWRIDAQDTVAALADFTPDVLIVDHYAFDHRWHGQVKTAVGCRMVALDDLGDRLLDVDLIVDHNYSDDHVAKHRISEAFQPTILGGPTYALLSAAYRERADFVVRDRVESVGVFLGGSDPANHSEAAMSAVRRALGPELQIEIATTSANPNLDRLRLVADADPACALSTDLPNLAAFFRRHDLQVGAGGGATWERCCIGAPTVAIAFADNHRPVLKPLDDLGVLSFSSRGDEDTEALAADIAALAFDPARRRDMSAGAMRLVDGLGLVRVGDAIDALIEGSRTVLTLAPATADDAVLAFPWRNDPAVRAHFHDPRPLALDGHQAWWRATLAASDRHLLMAMKDGVAVGVLRLDHADGSAEVSIYLDPAQSGRGLGREVLRAGVAYARRVGIDSLTASIKESNARSQAAFTAAGFEKSGDNWVRRVRP
jgi:UDP-2,4-diacetamido-2,4,6-trideoxy-beta-L-altropyranose hydrolase